MPALHALKARARRLKQDLRVVTTAIRDPRTPLSARVLAAVTLAYAASPIDLIPDFIPVIGYLDDLILVPAGIALTLKLIPAKVLQDARARAAQTDAPGRGGLIAAGIIAVLWAVGLWLAGRLAWGLVRG